VAPPPPPIVPPPPAPVAPVAPPPVAPPPAPVPPPSAAGTPVATGPAADRADDGPGDAGPGTEDDTDTDTDTATDADTETGSEPGASTADGPTVDGVRCPEGHANPPGSTTCRVCGGAVTDTVVTAVTRPSLGTLLVEGGEEIELDRPVLIGRRPPDEATIDGEDAQIVTLGGSDALSRSHAQFRFDGWAVQVVDLGSANHTYVTAPGADPVRLRADEPFTIEPGSVVSLADAVRITFDAS